jgi:DnaJ-class molecular chaperone
MVVVEFLLGAAALVAARQVHVWIFPWKDCPRCGGSKRNNSGDAFRRCRRCNSTGEVRRWGAGREQ